MPRQDIKEAYSVYLMVSNLVFHLYGCTEWLIFVCVKNNESNLYSNVLVWLWPLLSDNMHTMGALNSAIKNCAYLRKEKAISGSTDAMLEKLHFCILNFSCVCWDLPGNLIIVSSRPLSCTVLIIERQFTFQEDGNYDEMTCFRRCVIRTNLRKLHM